jgi:uncharacterized protein (DUF1778 family)
MTTETRTAPINIRALYTQRDLIDRAAGIIKKSRSDFMLEAACREAEHVLLDQRIFFLKDEEFKAFEDALSTPVKDNPALRKLLSRQAPWED